MSPPPPRRRFREILSVFGPAILLGFVALVVTYQFVEPAPPRTISIASGRPGGAYQEHSRSLSAQLEASDVTLEIVATSGSIDNIERLRRGEVDVAFVQGGTKSPDVDDPFVSVASLYYEPLWVFYRKERPVRLLSDLRGRSISIGPVGSGTRAIALELLADNGLGATTAKLDSSGGLDAANALREGKTQVVFLVGSTEDAAVRSLLNSSEVALLDFARAKAYSRRHRYLSHVELPRGVLDPAADLPSTTVRLIAPTAQLVVRNGFHPALIDLLLAAASRIFTQGDLVQEAREFPSIRFVDYPISPIAKRYFTSGRPFLYRYLPFRVAAFLDRIKILLLPLLTLVIPLARFVPPLYRWRIRSRIYRWYRDLLQIESGAATRGARDAIEALDQLEQDVAEITVPLSHADELYHLKHHIELVRARLRTRHLVEDPDDSV